MQTKTILATWVREGVQGNILLNECIYGGLAVTAEQRIDKLCDLIMKYAKQGETRSARDLINLVWPIMLEIGLGPEKEVIASQTPVFFDSIAAIPNPPFYSLDLSGKKPEAVDTVLVDYATRMSRIATTFVRDRKNNIPEQVVQDAIYESLCAGHLLIDSKKAMIFFEVFMGCLVNDHFSPKECDLMEKAPGILRDSLKAVPERNGHNLAENLLEYLPVLNTAIEYRSGLMARGEQHVKTLVEMEKVVHICLCHHLGGLDRRRIFLDFAKKNGKRY
jgi:hypothetical protein